jgi:hypothetical protein
MAAAGHTGNEPVPTPGGQRGSHPPGTSPIAVNIHDAG